MALDPQAERLLEQLAAAGRPPTHEGTVEEARLGWEALASLAGPGPHVDGVADIADGPVPMRAYGAVEGRPTLVWFHGGGFAIGNVDSYDHVCRVLALESGCAVVSVDYRLAPEHPFPAGVEDCYAAARWVASSLRPSRLAVGGDSAGGNLAAVTALLARESGGVPAIDFQLLVYPGADWSLDTPSMIENGKGLLLERETVRWFGDHYFGDQWQADDWRASPLRAPSLAGLPPAFVVTAEYDPIRDFGEDYAQRMEAEGVEVELRRYDGMIHAFLSLPTVLDQGRQALSDCAAALRRAIG